MTKNKIGIFGGTFNPVHRAHVEIANEFISKFSLDLLYVIPNNIPPMKESHGVSGEERFKMLEIAFSGNDKVKISDIELTRTGMSYTCDTVAEIKKIHPESELFLLFGDDWIDRFDKWKNYQYILDNANLVVAYRGDIDIKPSIDRLQKLSDKKILLLENNKILLSSTELRNGLKKDRLPDGVYEYITKRGLYRK
ncbi:MAG: nicotinate-nucleotide adenylyltransferase [Clostridia bacterium]|nr:nicotinate-nucleotide adenylyltransferase [Clostridia bacterium]